MTANQFRNLADSLESEFMTTEDRKAWVTQLRGEAKILERRLSEYRESVPTTKETTE